jgi:phosphoadenosine phosphosulfate reductase
MIAFNGMSQADEKAAGLAMIVSTSDLRFITMSSRISDERFGASKSPPVMPGGGDLGNAGPDGGPKAWEAVDGRGAPRTAMQDELDELERQSQLLEKASPEDVIAWTVARYFPRLTMATAFGPEGCVILSILAKVEPRVHVFNLDTGYQFKETLELRDRIAERYGIEVAFARAELTVEEFEAANGGPVYKTEPDRCCQNRKIEVLHHAVRGFEAWMSGIRRDQSPHRAAAPIVGWDKKFGLVKVSPLANWTKKDVWKRIADENIPYNPLHDQGYTSIGCWPCTRAVMFGEDERAGRWSGTAKTECGLHTVDK